MRRLLLLSLLGLGACVSAPGYRAAPVAIPERWRETDSVRAAAAVQPAARAEAANDPVEFDAEYWRRLGDTTLLRLLDEALGGNFDLRAAQARLRTARAERSRAALDLTPETAFNGGFTRRRFSSSSFPGTSGQLPDESVWDAGFDAAWEVDLFGRVQHSVRARSALVDASREDLRGVTVSLAAELARAYFDLRGAQEQLAVARRNSENQRRSLDLTRERLDAGRGTAFDTERAAAQLSVTLARMSTSEAEVRAAQHRIGVLVGRSPSTVAMELGPVESRPSLPDSVAIADPAVVVRGRPDVAAAERLAAAQDAFLSSARSEYLPRVSIAGSAGYTAGGFNALGDDGTFRYAVGPVISWPALNLGRVRANENAARARAETARAEYGQVALAAVAEVETALARYRGAVARVDQLEAASASSERAAELARMRFREGAADFLQVLDAERTQLDAQDLLAQGRTDAMTAYATVYEAIGGS